MPSERQDSFTACKLVWKSTVGPLATASILEDVAHPAGSTADESARQGLVQRQCSVEV